MLGFFKFNDIKLSIDENGKTNIILSVAPENSLHAKALVKPLKELLAKGKELTVKLDKMAHKRTLDQNAYMWKLIDIYADVINGGRTGGVMPEDIYEQMLVQYGVVHYLGVVNEAVDELRQVYKKVIIIDDCTLETERGRTAGKQLKCIVGSSCFDTKQMANLIDGLLDELSQMDMNEEQAASYQYYREEWKNE